MTFAKFPSMGNDNYLIVGTANKFQLNPRYCNMGFLHTFKIVVDKSGSTNIQLIHLHKVLENYKYIKFRHLLMKFQEH